MRQPLYSEAILDGIMKQLDHLTWKCIGCPQVPVCEDQANHGEARYCKPILIAAILGEEEWETYFRKKPLVQENP